MKHTHIETTCASIRLIRSDITGGMRMNVVANNVATVSHVVAVSFFSHLKSH